MHRNASPTELTRICAGAVHHYDEYGLADISQEPPEILQIHEETIAFVTEWLKEWNQTTTKSTS